MGEGGAAHAGDGRRIQRAVVDGWASLLNSLPHPLQVVIRTRELAPSALRAFATSRPFDTVRSAAPDSTSDSA